MASILDSDSVPLKASSTIIQSPSIASHSRKWECFSAMEAVDKLSQAMCEKELLYLQQPLDLAPSYLLDETILLYEATQLIANNRKSTIENRE